MKNLDQLEEDNSEGVFPDLLIPFSHRSFRMVILGKQHHEKENNIRG